MNGVFITGTGTDVGKTFIGTAIAGKLHADGVKVIPRKPIESGCIRQGDTLIPQDALKLKQASAYQGDLSEICPYRFEPPISPVRAAHLANKVLTTEQLASICMQGSEDGFTLVEGAGGFYSPLAENGLNADLALALHLPVLLVADDKLGALNNVLLNTEAILMRGLDLVAVVLNQMQDNLNEHMNNADDLREHLDCPVFSITHSNGAEPDLPDALIDLLKSPMQGGGSHIKVVG